MSQAVFDGWRPQHPQLPRETTLADVNHGHSLCAGCGGAQSPTTTAFETTCTWWHIAWCGQVMGVVPSVALGHPWLSSRVAEEPMPVAGVSSGEGTAGVRVATAAEVPVLAASSVAV